MTSPKPRRPQTPKASGLLDRDGLISSRELADWLGIPIGTLDQWASRGGGPFFHKVGRYRQYHPKDVRDWLKDQRHAVTGDRPERAA